MAVHTLTAESWDRALAKKIYVFSSNANWSPAKSSS